MSKCWSNESDDPTSEDWREYRRAQQQRRQERHGPRRADILALRGKGFDVVALTDFQFRVDGALDLYPIHRRYHHLPTKQRGDYKNAMEVAVRLLRVKAPEVRP